MGGSESDDIAGTLSPRTSLARLAGNELLDVALRHFAHAQTVGSEQRKFKFNQLRTDETANETGGKAERGPTLMIGLKEACFAILF